jgi:hypothetical protein
MFYVRSAQFLAFLVVGLAACIVPAATGAPKQPDGRKIYKKQCASCHGKAGEGVKGKYDEALVGDWSLEKLTRYISKNMPDDDPGTCVGPDADAVARFINDSFYSREARARNHPARVELVHLTNRQYQNTVADLIKFFTGKDNLIGEERGLKAAYYNSAGFNKKTQDQVDRQVDFDFGKSRPEAAGDGTNGFSMQWRGSVIADETGEYEFILKTPNGARLWVNQEDEPVIDASVASGQLDEHKALLKLIGGRAYPLKLDYFKAAKDKTASVSLQWKAPHAPQQAIPARNLTPSRTSPTFVVTTPFPADDSSVGYERGVAVSKAWDEAGTYAAIETANYVAKQLDSLSKSKKGDSNRVAKVEAFCDQFVATAFRRPLTEDQKRLFVSIQLKHTEKLEEAVKRVVLRTLKSPRFLYLGLDGGKPDDFTIASRLSFDLWDSLPDRELWKLAAQGGLRTREQVSREAQRMLSDSRAHAKMQFFLHHWLQMNRAEDLSKDGKLFPGFTPEIVADLRTSLNLFLEEAVWSGASDFRNLLTADYLFLNKRLADFYGVSTNTLDDFVKVKVDDKQRSGVITHPYLLAAFSYPKSTSPIHRGVFLTRNIIGRALKPPPMAVAFKDADFAPNLTMREKVSELTRPQACQTCHSVINPLGFSLEHYDAVGRFRTQDNNRPIDTAADYTTDEGKVVRLTGAGDIAQFAINSEHAQSGFVEQLFHQIVKQPVLAYGPDVMDRLRQSFVASGYNMQKLLVEIATVSALHRDEKIIVTRK